MLADHIRGGFMSTDNLSTAKTASRSLTLSCNRELAAKDRLLVEMLIPLQFAQIVEAWRPSSTAA